MLRAVLLLGGPTKQSSFGPFDQPSPFVKVAGIELIGHHLYALSRLPNIKDIVLLGFYDQAIIHGLIEQVLQYCDRPIRYLVESEEMGTAGGIAFHLDSIFSEDV